MNRGFIRSWLTYRLLYPIKKRRMQSLFSQLGLSEYSVVFDVGAHLGDKTRFFAEAGIDVVTIEPQFEYFQKLEQYFQDESHVTVLHNAVSSVKGTMELKTSTNHPTVSTLSQELIEGVHEKEGWSQVKWDAVEEVHVTTLDLLIEEYGTPDFVKIDVEGHEDKVLEGLTQALPLVSFEYLPVYPQPALASAKTMTTLGDYRFAFSPGETFSLQTSWLTFESLVSSMKSYNSTQSGDIYAKLYS